MQSSNYTWSLVMKYTGTQVCAGVHAGPSAWRVPQAWGEAHLSQLHPKEPPAAGTEHIFKHLLAVTCFLLTDELVLIKKLEKDKTVSLHISPGTQQEHCWVKMFFCYSSSKNPWATSSMRTKGEQDPWWMILLRNDWLLPYSFSLFTLSNKSE